MIPSEFPESNIKMRPPPDLEESQCAVIPAFVGEIEGGSCDGCPLTVVAWRPTTAELEAINHGASIFLSIIGGLPPHFLTVDFHSATHPA